MRSVNAPQPSRSQRFDYGHLRLCARPRRMSFGLARLPDALCPSINRAGAPLRHRYWSLHREREPAGSMLIRYACTHCRAREFRAHAHRTHSRRVREFRAHAHRTRSRGGREIRAHAHRTRSRGGREIRAHAHRTRFAPRPRNSRDTHVTHTRAARICLAGARRRPLTHPTLTPARAFASHTCVPPTATRGAHPTPALIPWVCPPLRGANLRTRARSPVLQP